MGIASGGAQEPMYGEVDSDQVNIGAAAWKSSNLPFVLSLYPGKYFICLFVWETTLDRAQGLLLSLYSGFSSEELGNQMGWQGIKLDLQNYTF